MTRSGFADGIVTNVESRTSKVENRQSNVESRVSAFDFQLSTFSLRHSTSAVGLRCRALTGVVAVLAAAATFVPCRGQTDIQWNGGAGVWSDPTAWDLGVVPNNGPMTYNVIIGNGSSDVSLDTSATVNRVTSAGMFRFLDGFSLSLTQAAGFTNNWQVMVDHAGTSGLFGSVTNNGFFWVRSGVQEMNASIGNNGSMWLGDGSFAGGTTSLRLVDDFSFNGTGELYFFSSAPTTAAQPSIAVTAGNLVTNTANHRIHGGSGVITGGGWLDNFGLIDADTPLRTLRLETAGFYNAGTMLAQSGNLRVAVDDWSNAGLVQVSGGGISQFSGTLVTNETGAAIQSVGGASLSINQDLTNFGLVTAAAGGRLSITGSSRLVTNAPSAEMEALGGTLRFGSTNGYVQNFGVLTADEGVVEFANGTDLFGGSLNLAQSRAEITAGTTTLTQLNTTMDPSSVLRAVDEGTGTVALTYNGLLENNGGRLEVVSDAGSTATFNLYGEVNDSGGTILSDGGDFNFGSNSFYTRLESSGPLSLDLRNSGDIRFTNVESTATSMDVSWTGTGGVLSFDNYRPETSTHLNVAGWTADGGSFSITGGSVLSASGLATLPVDTTLTVSGSGSRLTMNDLADTAAGSLVDLASGGRLAVPDLTVHGDFQLRGATFDGNLSLTPGAGFSVTTGTNRITGDLSWTGDREIEIAGGSTRLGLDGAMNIAPGSSLSFTSNSNVMEGSGTITNHGLIESRVLSNNNSAFLDTATVNASDGVIRASQSGSATSTYLQVRGTVDNAGLMEASGANLYFTGANVTNSGTLHAADHAAGSRMIFLGGSTVTDAQGTTIIEGANSTLEVSAASNVNLGALTMTNGASGTITDGGTMVTVTAPFDLEAGSSLVVQNSSRFNAPAVDVHGQMNVLNSAQVNGEVNVHPGGLVRLNSGVGTLNGDMTVLDVGAGITGDPGRVELVVNSGRLNGSGTIVNQGVIAGGAQSNSNSTFLDKDVVNDPSGVIRAYRNGTPTNTYFQLSGDITNAGVMEADEANLYFTGAGVVNSGTIRALAGDAPSKLIFLNGATVTDAGGLTMIDGADSRLEASGAANIDLGTLTFTNGAGASITNTNTVVTAHNVVSFDENSSSTFSNFGRFNAPGVSLGGEFMVQGSAQINAPIEVNPGGTITLNSGTGTINGQVTTGNDGKGQIGQVRLVVNSAILNGSDSIINSGLIEGGAQSNSNSTYLDKAVVNNSDGVIRAFRNGTPTNTFFQIRTGVDNAGVMEAVGANLYFTGATVTNSGTMRAVDDAAGSKLIFLGGTTVTDAGGATMVDGAASRLEASGAVNVEVGNLTVSNGAQVALADANTRVTASNVVDFGEQTELTVNTSSRFNAAGINLDGHLFVQNSASVNAPITVGPTGAITANASLGVLNGDVVVERAGGNSEFGTSNGEWRMANAESATHSVNPGTAGRIELIGNSARIDGTGTIFNSGVIEGGAPSNNNSTFLDKAVVNNSDGVIRAFQNGSATGTVFQVRGTVDNAGLMVGDVSRLYLPGATVTNSGAIESINGGSVEFVSGTNVADAGGTLRVAAGSLGIIDGSGTRVDATTTVEETGLLAMSSGAQLGGPGAQVDGELRVRSSRVDAPVTVGPTGWIHADSGVATFSDDVLVETDGAADGVMDGRVTLDANNARINGTGVITNHGLIEGGAPSNNNHTYLDNEMVNATDGTIRAFGNGGATGTTFHLSGNVVNQGQLEADAATLALDNVIVDNTSGFWSAVNGGTLRVDGSFVGGSSGSNTTIDGPNSQLVLTNGSLVGFDTLMLTNGGDALVNGTNTALAILAPLDIPVDSDVTVANGGRLHADGIDVDGSLTGQGGRVVSDVHLGATGVLHATSGTTTIDGNVTTTSKGSLVHVENPSTSLVVDGTLNNAVDATVRLHTNTTALSGAGLFTNAGLLEGDAWSTNNTVSMSKNLVNTGDVVAASLSGATGTTFRLTSPFITNSGTMSATGSNLSIFGSQVTHSGTFRAENGQFFSLESGATVTNLTGSAEVDGDASVLRILSSSTATFSSLALTNGGDVLVDNASLNVTSPLLVGDSSVLTVQNLATLGGVGVQVNGTMQAGRATVTMPVTVGPTGELFANSSSGTTFDAPVMVQNDGGGQAGRIALLINGSWMLGSGLITNSGVIEAGAPGNNQNTYIYNNILNNADGTIRAYQSAAGTNTNLQLSGSITNNGVMEADGGNLYLTGASVNHGGLIRAVDHAAGSRVIVLNGSSINSIGGDGSIDGALSTLEISGNADASFDTLSFSNGGTGSVTDSGSTLTGNVSIGAGSSLSVVSSAILSGAGVQVDGGLTVGTATVNAPTTVGPTGTLSITGTGASGAVFNNSLTIEGPPPAKTRGAGGSGTVSLTVNNARISGGGQVVNHGTIEGGAATTTNFTYLLNNLINEGDGTVRAFRSGASSSTTFRLAGPSVTNNGTFEADQATLSVGTSGVLNNGTIRTMNGGRFISDGPVNSTPSSTIEIGNGTGAEFRATLTSDGFFDIGDNLVEVDGALNFGPTARFQSLAGSILRTDGSVGNASTDNVGFDMRQAILNMIGTVVTLEVAGADVGNDPSGLEDNFAIGELLVSNSTSILSLLDTFDNQGDGVGNEALYVETLTLAGGTTQLFLNGRSLYYGTFNGNASQVILGGGVFEEITGLVPEPGTAGLLLGLGWIMLRRRRLDGGEARRHRGTKARREVGTVASVRQGTAISRQPSAISHRPSASSCPRKRGHATPSSHRPIVPSSLRRSVPFSVRAILLAGLIGAMPCAARAIPPGDADSNEVVDLRDLLAIRNSFGASGPPGSIPADVTGDGAVNNADLTFWRQNFPFIGNPSGPYIFIADPLDGSLTGNRRPTVVIDYSPTGLNVDPDSLTVSVDGVDRSPDVLHNARHGVLPIEVALADGPHSIVATVADVLGNESTATSDFELTSLTLRPRVSARSGRAPFTPTFFPDVVWADYAPSCYQWDFAGDGTYDQSCGFTDAARPDPRSFTYQEEGVYTVGFKVTLANGTSAETTLQVAATETFASASPGNGTAPLTVFLHGIAADLDDPIVLYEWDFDYDGAFSADHTSTTSASTPTIYGLPGVYEPVFRATHLSGAVVEHPIVKREVHVSGSGNPIAIASAAQGPNAFTVNFFGTGLDNGSIVQYEWDFEDDGVWDFSSPGSGNTSHTYATAGVKIAALRVTDNEANTAIDRVRVETLAPAELEVLDDTVVPANGEQVVIRTTLTTESTVWLYVRSRDGRQIRTLVDHVVRPAGAYDDLWDGRDFRYERAHAGAYFAVLEYSYPGRTDHLDLSDTTGGEHYFAPRTTVDPGQFNAFDDDFWEMGFTIPTASRASLYILPGGSDRAKTAFDDLALGAGDYTYFWAGVNSDGQLASTVNYLWSVNAWTLGDNAVVVKAIPEVSAVSIEPNLFSPTDKVPQDPTAAIQFETTARSAVLVKLIGLENGTTFRSWRTDFEDPGVQVIEWDGRSAAGDLLSPGSYRASFLAVDEDGNVSVERNGLVLVRY